MELIGKQIAIETILGQPPELHYPSWYAAQIENLPPAPPEYLAEQAGILVTDSDTISRAKAIEALRAMQTYKLFAGDDMLLIDQAGAQAELMMLPPAQLGTNLAEVGTDCISREQAIDKFIDGLEEIFADIRERHIDDSVCGLCEYDGAYIGQSGDWCNECPGFDSDDCFKLSDKIRKKWAEEIIKALPPAQPEIIDCRKCKFASGDSRICMKFGHSPIGELDFCAWAERRTDD